MKRLDAPALRNAAAASVTAAALALLVLAGGWTTRLDDALRESWMRRQTLAPQPDLCVVAIDAASIAEAGPLPWPHQLHALALDRLALGGVAAIGYDVDFSHPDRDPVGDALLTRAIRNHGGVVLAGAADGGGPIPELARTARAVARLDAAVPGTPSPFVLAMQQVARPGNIGNADGIRYVAPPLPAQRFRCGSFADLLGGREPAWIKGRRWVLIGATGEPGAAPTAVETAAGELAALLQGHVARPLPPTVEQLLSVLLAAALCLWIPRRRPASLAAIAVLSCLAPLAISALLLAASRWWLPPLPCCIAIAVVWSMILLGRYFAGRGQSGDAACGLATLGQLRTRIATLDTSGGPCSLLMLHISGRATLPEAAIRDIAALLRRRGRRPADIAVRVSTHAFALLLPDTDTSAVAGLDNDLRGDIAALLVRHELHCVTQAFTEHDDASGRQGERLLEAAGLAGALGPVPARGKETVIPGP